MIIENTEALKSWLNQSLSRICDADPAALAKYILALVKKDKTEDELKAFCLDQLEVFLMQDTKSFVDVLFEALKSKSYLYPQNENSTVSSPPNKSPVKNNATSVDPPLIIKSELEKEKVSVQPLKEVTSIRPKFSQNTDSRTKLSGSPEHKSFRPRYRSRSRSRENDSRRPNSEDERNKTQNYSKNFPQKNEPRRRKYNDYYSSRNDRSGRDKRSDRRNSKYSKRGRDRSRSRSRSSRSSRSSTRSSSRSLSPEKISKNNEQKKMQMLMMDSVGDTDYRLKLGSSKSAPIPSNNNYSNKISKRCQDYDERGYCLKGEFCCYDHGTSPILVDDVSVLNFNVGPEDKFEGSNKIRSKSPMPPLPPTPPPAPPLPPMPPPVACVTEPYNPESPGIFREPPHMGYFVPPPLYHMPPPPLPPQIAMFNKNSKPQRIRELIGVPTVPDITVHAAEISHSETNKNESEENDEKKVPVPQNVLKCKTHFDYNRLGPRKYPRMNNHFDRTLELRKIPRSLNTISHLNDHFSKFGHISNIQVYLDGDPEAALVQFANHPSALAAYRSSDAIFNNRFIKVRFFNKDYSSNNSGSTPLAEIQDEKKDNLQENLNSVMKSAPMPEKANLYTSAKSTTRTVYIPSAKKQTTTFRKVENVPKIPDPSKLKEDKRKNAFQMKMKLLKQKEELLIKRMQHKTDMLDKLSTCKNEEKKAYLVGVLQSMSAKITVLKNEFQKEHEDLKNLLKTSGNRPVVSKTEAEKELLDAEMDLYNKQHKGIDTAELLSKVQELKQKAKALGIIDNLPHNRITNRRRNSRTAGPVYLSSHARVDHRPKKILVSNCTNKDGLLKHLYSFGKVEGIDEHPNGIIVKFSTRQEAEKAFTMGSKFGDTLLNFAWYQDPLLSTQNSDISAAAELKSNDVDDLVEAEEEEEEDDEEDSEARSWRR